jgi:Rrf2 family protein
VLNRKNLNALRILVDVAAFESDGPVTRKDIALRQQLAIPVLDRLLTLLISARLIKSVRGREGGYCLAKEASEINALDVILATDPEPFSLEPLAFDPENPPTLHARPVKPSALKASEQTAQLFHRSLRKCLRQMPLHQFVKFAQSRGIGQDSGVDKIKTPREKNRKLQLQMA